MPADDLHPAEQVFAASPVIPVVTVDRPENAVPLARALVAGGLAAIEVTLRTPGAVECIRAIAAEVPEAQVGAGTVRGAAQLEEAVAAGAAFLVTPATTAVLLDRLEECPVPVLPGVATPTEVALVLERGIETMKLFPAEAIGGIALLRALAGPFPEARFCPTGGIGPERAPAYLALENVVAVGGSWVAEHDPLAPDWATVTAVAHAAAQLRQPKP